MNEVLKTITERYSCRDFKTEMPSDEMLNIIADAAVKAPSGMNNQPWRVIVLKNKELMKEIEEEGMNFLKNSDQTAYERIMGRGGKLFYDAPCMIIVPTPNGGAGMDCGILLENIALAAQSLGLATVICGLTGCAFANKERAAEFSKKLGFPDGYAFCSSVLIGYPNTVTKPHQPDKSKISFVE